MNIWSIFQMPEALTLSGSMADAEPDLSIFENKTGLAEDLKFLASMPELCDVTFLVGDTREPVCAVKVINALLLNNSSHSFISYQNLWCWILIAGHFSLSFPCLCQIAVFSSLTSTTETRSTEQREQITPFPQKIIRAFTQSTKFQSTGNRLESNRLGNSRI